MRPSYFAGCSLLVASLVLAGGTAAAADPAWIGPVRDDRTGAVDDEMTAELRLVTPLLGPSTRGWRAGPPIAGECPTCAVVTIAGHRAPEFRYEIAVQRANPAQSRSLVWTAGPGMTPFLLAEALALHCLFLLGEPLVPAVAGNPPATKPSTLAIGLGPVVTRSWNGLFTTGGTEIIAHSRGPLGVDLTMALGFEAFGAGRNPIGRYQYQVTPATLLVGRHWQRGDISAGLGLGGRFAVYAFEFQTTYLEETRDTAISAVAEATVSWRVRRSLSLALAFRPAYTFDAVSIGREDVFEMPRWFWQVAGTLLLHL